MCFAEVGDCSTPANRPLGVARGSAAARNAAASVELLSQQTEANQKAALKSLVCWRSRIAVLSPFSADARGLWFSPGSRLAPFPRYSLANRLVAPLIRCSPNPWLFSPIHRFSLHHRLFAHPRRYFHDLRLTLSSNGTLFQHGSLCGVGALPIPGWSLPVDDALPMDGSLNVVGALSVYGSLNICGALNPAGSLNSLGTLAEDSYDAGQFGGPMKCVWFPCAMMYGFGGGSP